MRFSANSKHIKIGVVGLGVLLLIIIVVMFSRNSKDDIPIIEDSVNSENTIGTWEYVGSKNGISDYLTIGSGTVSYREYNTKDNTITAQSNLGSYVLWEEKSEVTFYLDFDGEIFEGTYYIAMADDKLQLTSKTKEEKDSFTLAGTYVKSELPTE